MPDSIALLSTWVTVPGTVVTAIATVFLWRVTRILAVETKRMADVSSRPQVVATLEPNRWAMNHADLTIENTGNGTAFDIHIAFDPSLPREESRPEREVPLQRISMLKPRAFFSSYLCEFRLLLGQSYKVTISWRRDPDTDTRDVISYSLNMQDVDGVSRLGPPDPATELAEQVKKIREDWQWVASGSRKLSVNTYSEFDRLHERRLMERRRRRMRQEQIESTTRQSSSENTAPPV